MREIKKKAINERCLIGYYPIATRTNSRSPNSYFRRLPRSKFRFTHNNAPHPEHTRHTWSGASTYPVSFRHPYVNIRPSRSDTCSLTTDRSIFVLHVRKHFFTSRFMQGVIHHHRRPEIFIRLRDSFTNSGHSGTFSI